MSPCLLLWLNAGFLLVFIGVFGWAALRAKRARRLQDGLIASLDPDSSDPWFRINLSRPGHFSSRLKLVGFEARGVLVSSAERIRILAELPSGERIDRSLPKSDLDLRWIGNPTLASANLHWISVGPPEEPLYITADTGLYALPSRQATADLCRIIDVEWGQDLRRGLARQIDRDFDGCQHASGFQSFETKTAAAGKARRHGQSRLGIDN